MPRQNIYKIPAYLTEGCEQRGFYIALNKLYDDESNAKEFTEKMRALGIAQLVLRFTVRGNYCIFSNKTIAAKCGVSEATVKRDIFELERAGIISRREVNKNKTTKEKIRQLIFNLYEEPGQ